jgi:hypothetical protein
MLCKRIATGVFQVEENFFPSRPFLSIVLPVTIGI